MAERKIIEEEFCELFTSQPEAMVYCVVHDERGEVYVQLFVSKYIPEVRPFEMSKKLGKFIRIRQIVSPQ